MSSSPVSRRRAARARRAASPRRVLAVAGVTAALGVASLIGAFVPVPGAAAGETSTVADLAVAGAQGYQAELVSGSVPGRTQDLSVTSIDPRDKNALKEIARGMAAEYGWTGSEFTCLDKIWEKESGWNPFAVNAESGAYGIPQSWPAEKLATAGADWRTNPITQMTWGMNYIKAVYGKPCVAWNQHGGSY